jgi:biopolymer transport protein ExbD
MIRLRKNNKKKEFNDSINLIPMINLIFLLLIFFLLTGVIQKKDEIEVTIPESFFGKKKIELKETLTVRKDGSFIWNNREVEKEDILNILENDSKIIINIDEEASIKKFNELIKLFKMKEIKKVFINVKHKNDKI